MSTKKKIALVFLGIVVLLCGGFAWFVNWANSEEGQAEFRRIETKQAVASATAAPQATAQAQATAQSAATGTAVMAGIDARLQQAELVFEEGLDEGSPFIAQNIRDLTVNFEDGAFTTDLTWNGFYVWEIGQTLTDFAAELDCANYGDGINCGFAYGIQNVEGARRYYASLISGSWHCAFFDSTTSFSVSHYPGCKYPHSDSSRLQRLRLEKFGANVRFYVNGQLMDTRTLEDERFFSGGMGIIFGRAGGEQSDMNDVRLDHLKVWNLP